MKDDKEKIFKPRDFSKLLGVSVKTLQRWDNEGKLKANRTDTDRRYYTYDQLTEIEKMKGADLMAKQSDYERESYEYPPDHPRWKFQHSFMRTGYLPCTVVQCENTQFDVEDVAEEIKRNAYFAQKGGTFTLDQLKFCRIWYNRFSYIYNGGILTPHGTIDGDVFKSQIVQMLFNIGLETKNMDSLADHIYKTYIFAYKIDAYENPYKIPFANGDLYLNEDCKGFTFYEGQLSAVPYRFKYDFVNIDNVEEPDFPNFKMWRDELFEEEDVYTLQQMLGYLLIPSNKAQEAFFIIGKGGTGKSILTDCIIPEMLGDATSPVSIGQFFNDKFQVGTSEGKLCMVDDDIGEAKLSYEDSGRFKNFVTARTIKVEHKYCSPTKITNSAKIVCAGNHMINSDDKTDGFTRRLHPIYVKSRVIEKVDTLLPDKIAGEIQNIVLWALEGLLFMMQNDCKPYWSDNTEQKFRYYAEGQKWEEQFIQDCFCYKENTSTYSSDIRDALVEWMKDNSEVCGEGTLTQKFGAVTKWLKDEGADKLGYTYKRGMKKGNSYNARGYINMSPKVAINSPTVYTDEVGHLKLKVGRRVD